MQELDLGGYRLQYERHQDEITVTGIAGITSELLIPDTIEACKVVSIEKKAFMANRTIKSVTLPKSMREIGDWAFAHCDMLKEISLYPNEIAIGKGIVLNSDKLAKVNIVCPPKEAQFTKEELSQLACLLASTLTVLDAPFLFTPHLVGSTQWLKQYETRVSHFLARDDMEDYAKTVSCGEEDYESTNLDNFLSEKRKAKVRMIFVRLLGCYALAEKDRDAYMQYLRQHMPPEAENETWQVVRDEHGDEEAYFEVMAQAGCITNDNIQTLIADLGQTRAQMRAYLLRYQQTKLAKVDFFDSFSL